MGLKTVTRKLDELTLDPDNARKHNSDVDVEAIRLSLLEFGQQTPIVVDEADIVVKGNGTMMAALKLGWTEIETIKTTLTGDQLRAYAIADNRTAELSQWNTETLIAQLNELEATLQTAAGYSIDALDKLAAEVGKEYDLAMGQIVDGMPDEPPEPLPEPPVIEYGPIDLVDVPCVEVGDLWYAGKHIVLCADNTKEANWKKLLGTQYEQAPKTMANVTDPPYGIGADKAMARKNGTKYGTAEAAKKIYAKTDWDKPVPHGMLQRLMAFKESVIFGGNYYPMPPGRCWLIWDKENHETKHAHAELAWTNLDKPVQVLRHMWNGMIRKDKEPRHGHPTQKPVGVMAWVIKHTQAADILDVYLGSGSTLVACEQLGRRCYGMESYPAYVQMALDRYKALTGKEPILAETGETLSQVMTRRLAKG